MPPVSPDVRVRLSAEGVAEVIAAMHKVGAAAKGAAVTGATSFITFGAAVKTVTATLAPLFALLSAAAVFGFAKEVSRWADELIRFSQILGISANDLRGFLVVATKSDVSVDTLRRGLIRFVEGVEQAKAGSGDFASAFKTLKIDVNEFLGLGTAEQLALLGTRMRQVADGTAKTTAFVRIFGNRASLLIPLLNEIGGSGGLEGVRKRAEELGIAFEDDLTNATATLWNEFGVLNVQIKSLAQQFLGGLAPSIVQVLKRVQGALGSSSDDWETWGENAGLAMRAVLLQGEELLDLLTTMPALIQAAWDDSAPEVKNSINNALDASPFIEQAKLMIATAEAVSQTILEANEAQLDAADIRIASKKDPAFKFISGAAPKSKFQELNEAFQERRAERRATLTSLPDPLRLTRPDAEDEAVLQDQFRADIEIAREAASQLIKIARARGQAEEEIARNQYENGLISLEEYYKRRKAAIEGAADEEVKALKTRAAVESQEFDVKKKAIDLLKTQTSITEAGLVAEREVALAASEAATQRFAIARQVAEAEREIADLQGRAGDAQAIRDQRRLEDLRILFGKSADAEGFREVKPLPEGAVGPPELETRDEAIERRLKTAEKVFAATEEFQAKSRILNTEQIEFSRQKEEIDSKVSSGLLSQVEGEERILQIQRDRIPVLKALAKLKLDAAVKTGKEEDIQAAQADLDSIARAEKTIQAADDVLTKFRATFADAFRNSLNTFLTDGIRGAENLSQAMRNMAESIIDSLQRMVAQIIATQIALAGLRALGGFGGGGGEGGGGGGGGGFDPRTVASGGLITGPGTGTSDSIPAMLSTGEYVVRASSVSKPGMLQHLHRINIGFPVRRAAGGIIRGEGTGTSDSNLIRVSDFEFVTKSSVVRQPGVLGHLNRLNEEGSGYLRRFAEGGLVTPMSAPASVGQSLEGAVTVGLEDGLVLRTIETRNGERSILKVLQKNARTVKQIVGG